MNDTEWFRDLPERTATLRKVQSTEELEAGLQELLRDHYAEERTWDSVATTLIRDYRTEQATRSSQSPRRPGSLRGATFASLDFKPYSRVKHRLGSLWHRGALASP